MEKSESGNVESMQIENSSPVEPKSFSTSFPKCLRKVLPERWPAMASCLELHGISCTLDLVKCSMTVSTTRDTSDPDIFFKARDIVQLMSRGGYANWASCILEHSYEYEIIKTGYQEGGLCALYGIDKEQFHKRQDLFLSSMKELRKLISTAIVVLEDTVAIVGGTCGLKIVRRVVKDCIVHNKPPNHVIRLKKYYEERGGKRSEVKMMRMLEDFHL